MLLKTFWENHDPTQGMRQGNDVGTQYRSLLGWYGEEQRVAAEASRAAYQQALTRAGHGLITTEMVPAPTFYFAEAYHQQYLHTHPNGYCGMGGTNVSCPIGVGGVTTAGCVEALANQPDERGRAIGLLEEVDALHERLMLLVGVLAVATREDDRAGRVASPRGASIRSVPMMPSGITMSVRTRSNLLLDARPDVERFAT